MAFDCKLHYRSVISSATLPAVTQVVSEKRYPSIVGGNESVTGGNRYSIWAAQPREVLQFRAGGREPFGELQRALDKYRLEDSNKGELPEGLFGCGWIGYFGYELNGYIERLPETAVADIDIPLIHLCFYDRAICYDHAEKKWWLVAVQMPDDSESADRKLAGLGELLAEAEQTELDLPDAGALGTEAVDISKFRCIMSR